MPHITFPYSLQRCHIKSAAAMSAHSPRHRVQLFTWNYLSERNPKYTLRSDACSFRAVHILPAGTVIAMDCQQLTNSGITSLLSSKIVAGGFHAGVLRAPSNVFSRRRPVQIGDQNSNRRWAIARTETSCLAQGTTQYGFSARPAFYCFGCINSIHSLLPAHHCVSETSIARQEVTTVPFSRFLTWNAPETADSPSSCLEHSMCMMAAMNEMDWQSPFPSL